jgi:hypothetical protein
VTDLPLGPVTAGASNQRLALLRRRFRLPQAGTISYNVVEAAVAIVAGTAASSTADRFGLDSVVEVSSAAAVAWQSPQLTHNVGSVRHCG